MKVTTKSGFKCDINENITKDWRLMVAIAEAQKDDPQVRITAAIDMVRLILGDNEQAFYKHLESKNPDHIVSEQDVTDDLKSIIDKIKSLKN